HGEQYAAYRFPKLRGSQPRREFPATIQPREIPVGLHLIAAFERILTSRQALFGGGNVNAARFLAINRALRHLLPLLSALAEHRGLEGGAAGRIAQDVLGDPELVPRANLVL